MRKTIGQQLRSGHTWLRLSKVAGIVFAFTPLVLAQQAPGKAGVAKPISPSQPAVQAAASHSQVANLDAGTNVISVQYHCASQPSGSCAITVTKKQFDALVQALDPNMDQSSRQSLAAEYSRLLIMAAEARSRHIDQSPELQTLLAFSTLQLLADRLVRDITHKAVPVSEDEVEKYFRDHRRDYEEVMLSKIFIPIARQAGLPANDSTAERAAGLYKRAMAGESFEVLQREVGEASSGSNGRLGPMRCQLLPQAHREICDLQAGQISPPQADSSGYSIYKLESRRSPELQDVRSEIRAMLERQRVDAEIYQVRTPVSLQLDERYFGKLPELAPDLAAKHGMHSPAGSVPAVSKAPDHHHH